MMGRLAAALMPRPADDPSRQRDYRRLARKVRCRGEPMDIFGVPHTEAPEVTAEIGGYEEPGGSEPRTVTRTVLIGNMGPDGDW
jgi:hypothetical protein